MIVGGVLVVVVHGADTLLDCLLIEQSLNGRADYCIQMVMYFCLAGIAIIIPFWHSWLITSELRGHEDGADVFVKHIEQHSKLGSEMCSM